MASPIFAITLQRKQGTRVTSLFIRRTPKPKKEKNRNNAFGRDADVNEVEAVLNSWADYFPKAQRAEWVVVRFNSKPNGLLACLQLRRINQMDYERMTFAEAYPLFMAYMRMYMTQEKQ